MYGIFRSILTIELLLIFLLIFLQISGFTNPPSPSVAINATTPDTINVKVTATPAPKIIGWWYYDPEKGYFVKYPT